MTRDPNKLDYERPRGPSDGQSDDWSREYEEPAPYGCITAVIAGSAVSLIYFPLWRQMDSGHLGVLPVVLGGTKLVVAITLLAFPRWRQFGIVLLLSIGVGGLIFFGACSTNFTIGR
ncbi:MAG TPA: hypothetical protein VK968_08845 [Roseimicrobium sp.]|nr:hypothetical protein [Roseimicrobium sp.]